MATPATLTAVTGGLLLPALPTGFEEFALIVMFLGLVGAVLSVVGKASGW